VDSRAQLIAEEGWFGHGSAHLDPKVFVRTVRPLADCARIWEAERAESFESQHSGVVVMVSRSARISLFFQPCHAHRVGRTMFAGEIEEVRGIATTDIEVDERGFHVALGDTVTISGGKCDDYTALWPLVFASTCRPPTRSTSATWRRACRR